MSDGDAHWLGGNRDDLQVEWAEMLDGCGTVERYELISERGFQKFCRERYEELLAEKQEPSSRPR